MDDLRLSPFLWKEMKESKGNIYFHRRIAYKDSVKWEFFDNNGRYAWYSDGEGKFDKIVSVISILPKCLFFITSSGRTLVVNYADDKDAHYSSCWDRALERVKWSHILTLDQKRGTFISSGGVYNFKKTKNDVLIIQAGTDGRNCHVGVFHYKRLSGEKRLVYTQILRESTKVLGMCRNKNGTILIVCESLQILNRGGVLVFEADFSANRKEDEPYIVDVEHNIDGIRRREFILLPKTGQLLGVRYSRLSGAPTDIHVINKVRTLMSERVTLTGTPINCTKIHKLFGVFEDSIIVSKGIYKRKVFKKGISRYEKLEFIKFEEIGLSAKSGNVFVTEKVVGSYEVPIASKIEGRGFVVAALSTDNTLFVLQKDQRGHYNFCIKLISKKRGKIVNTVEIPETFTFRKMILTKNRCGFVMWTDTCVHVLLIANKKKQRDNIRRFLSEDDKERIRFITSDACEEFLQKEIRLLNKEIFVEFSFLNM